MILIYNAEAYTHTHTQDALVVASKEVGMQVNADKTRYLVILEIRMQDEVM